MSLSRLLYDSFFSYLVLPPYIYITESEADMNGTTMSVVCPKYAMNDYTVFILATQPSQGSAEIHNSYCMVTIE